MSLIAANCFNKQSRFSFRKYEFEILRTATVGDAPLFNEATPIVAGPKMTVEFLSNHYPELLSENNLFSLYLSLSWEVLGLRVGPYNIESILGGGILLSAACVYLIEFIDRDNYDEFKPNMPENFIRERIEYISVLKNAGKSFGLFVQNLLLLFKDKNFILVSAQKGRVR